MDKLRILVTGGGAPGIEGTLYSLRNHDVITCDMDKNAVGQYLSEKFYTVFPADDPMYLVNIQAICDYEKIDVVLPQCTAELDKLYEAHFNRAKVAISGRNVPKNAVSTGKIVRNIEEIAYLARIYRDIVIKPLDMSGSRGVRIVTSEKRDFYRKPGIPVVDLLELNRELPDKFELFAMPLYKGTEVTVDCFRGKGFTAIPRIRHKIRSGITFEAELTRDRDLIRQCRDMAERLDLKYAFGFQFIDGKCIECNPRVQGTMVASTLAGANMIEAACLHAVGRPYKFDIDWNTKFYRYWGGVTNKKIRI